MTRVSATPFYFFEEGYFDGLRDALGEHLRLWVVQIDGAVAVAALFVETCGIVQYHLSGSDPAFASEGLMKLIVHAVRSWAKERGDTELHLGGGVGSAADSLLQFKAGFSPRRHPFHTLRVVVDQGEYARGTPHPRQRRASGARGHRLGRRPRRCCRRCPECRAGSRRSASNGYRVGLGAQLRRTCRSRERLMLD
jgi:hypothetical protein